MNLLKDNRVKEWFWLENDLVDRTDLTVYEKMVYVVLVRYSNNDDSSCFPSYPTIASKVGCSERQAIRCINSLEDKGFIYKKQRNKAGKREKDSNLYYVGSIKEGSDCESPRHDSQSPPVMTHSHGKKTNTKKTNIKRLNISTTCSDEKHLVVDTNKELIENETHLIINSIHKLEKVRKMDKDRLIKSIEIFNEKNGKYFSLLEKIYADDGNFIKKEAPSTDGATKPNNSICSNNRNIQPIKTRYHNINQTFTKYSPEELEKMLLENQKERKMI